LEKEKNLFPLGEWERGGKCKVGGKKKTLKHNIPFDFQKKKEKKRNPSRAKKGNPEGGSTSKAEKGLNGEKGCRRKKGRK